MWMSRRIYEQLLIDVATLTAEHRLYAEQNKVLQTTQDWLRARVNQLERERAELFKHVTGLRIPVPEIHPTVVGGLPVTRADLEAQMKRNLNEMPSFEDPGDDEAARLGISHREDGTLHYENK